MKHKKTIQYSIHPLSANIKFEIAYRLKTGRWMTLGQTTGITKFECSQAIVAGKMLLDMGRVFRLKNLDDGKVLEFDPREDASRACAELNLFYNRLTDRYGKKTEKP